jgi:hypothetical protein
VTTNLTVDIRNEPRPIVDLTKTLALLGVCSGGSIESPVELTSGTDIDSTIGYGPGTTLIKTIHAIAPQVKVVWQKITSGTAGVIGTVTETPSGTGPLITITGAPYDSYKFAVKVTKGGVVGTAVVKVSTDGSTYGDDIPVPVELPASILGTVDLTSIVLADLNTLTHIGTSDIGGPITTTFTTPSSIQDIADQINTAYGAGADEAVAEIVAGRFLRLSSLTVGAASTFALGAGTAHTLLGLSGGPFAGVESAYTIPNTGAVVTFPATSAYVLNTVYTASTTQPRFSVAAATAAFDTLRAWAKITDGIPQTLGLVALLLDAVDGADTRQHANALSSRSDEFFADYLFPDMVMGSSLHVPSATLNTNNSNITAGDAAVKLAMQGHVDPMVEVDHGDCYFTTAYGSLRRSTEFWRILHWAKYRISSDPGNRSQEGFSQVDTRGPDLLTFARNEDIATHKMRAAGFTVAEREGGKSYITRGVTRANGAITPDFKHSGVVNAALLAARQLTPYARLNINTDPYLTPAGRILPHIADAIEFGGNEIIMTALVNEEHISRGSITVDRAEIISTTNRMTLRAVLQAKGQIIFVTLSIGIVGTITDPLLVAAAA